MFKIKARFEDLKLKFFSEDGLNYQLEISDVAHPEEHAVKHNLTWQEVQTILALNLSPEGEIEGDADFYIRHNTWLSSLSQHLRPVP